jgi:hypothetical protein
MILPEETRKEASLPGYLLRIFRLPGVARDAVSQSSRRACSDDSMTEMRKYLELIDRKLF